MSNKSSSGISTLSLLGVVFITLKLTGYITWSWWYVTMPFWGAIALLLIIGIATLIVMGILYLFVKWSES